MWKVFVGEGDRGPCHAGLAEGQVLLWSQHRKKQRWFWHELQDAPFVGKERTHKEIHKRVLISALIGNCQSVISLANQQDYGFVAAETVTVRFRLLWIPLVIYGDDHDSSASNEA